MIKKDSIFVNLTNELCFLINEHQLVRKTYLKHRQQQMEWREIRSISEIQLNLKKKHRLAETNRNLELNHSTNQ